jgi:enoyl-CoA hydratase/carnithine racemase
MSAAASEKPVLWSVDARGVATVTLNRPHVNNAYDGAMIGGLHDAIDALEKVAALRVVVLRGNGKHFQAGADLAWIRGVAAESEEENVRVSRATAEAVRRLDGVSVPTLALVQGGCFGGGTGIVAACDIVVATDDAVFAITETRWGLMAGISSRSSTPPSACARCAATPRPANASTPPRRAGSAWCTRSARRPSSTRSASAWSTRC